MKPGEFLLNVVVRESTAILELLAVENRVLLVREDACISRGDEGQGEAGGFLLDVVV